ncbi:MAG: SDH family Clp fold serine proteinase [Chloroflexota bacterium]
MRTPILADMARKAVAQVYETIYGIVSDRISPERAWHIAQVLSQRGSPRTTPSPYGGQRRWVSRWRRDCSTG